MPDGLYDRDTLAWAEQQADLLRRLAAGERVNDAVDWPHVIEEVQDVGLSQLRSCSSLLRQAMMHLLKLHAWPDSLAANHWREEARTFLVDAEAYFALSMRQRLDMEQIYAKALFLVQSVADDSGEARALPSTCPFSLDDLLTSRPDVKRLAGLLERTQATLALKTD